MSDSQLRQTISQLSHAASGSQYQSYAAPTPQRTAGKRPLFPSFPYYSSPRPEQRTKKTLPTGQHLRLRRPERPRAAAVLRKVVILRLRLQLP